MLKNIFGGKKKAAGPTTQEALAKLQETEDILEKKQAHIEKLIQQNTAEARANASTNKRKALLALKQKKLHEKEQLHIDGVLSTIQFQRSSLENASTNAEIMSVMAIANQALKDANKNMSYDDVEKTMEELAEEQELVKEISDLISNPMGQAFDEDELEAELEALKEETLNEELIRVQPVPVANIDKGLPDVPPEILPVRQNKKKEVDDMAELAEWAS
uniref:Tropomodulin n=2 Tax=Panagrolaimus sp. PS1159 TaxID=55785 RepID=A0AC35F5W3_9BILA